MVQGLPNVRSVANELEIAGVSSLTARTNDSLITSNVKLRFLDAEFSVLHVKVVTEAGIVYLMGIVTEREAGNATELARTTGGVRKVVKVFEYCRPTDEVCRPPAPPAAPRAHAGG
jgi:osmotically-inducible protein OsmY